MRNANTESKGLRQKTPDNCDPSDIFEFIDLLIQNEQYPLIFFSNLIPGLIQQSVI